MKKFILGILLFPSLGFAIGAGGINLSPNPRFLLISSNTFLYVNTFQSSVTFVDSRMMINGQAYTWPSSITGGNCLQVDGSGVLSWATCGSGGGGGGGSLFAEPYGVTVSSFFFPRSDFLLLNGAGAEESGISTVTWRGSTGSVTTPWLFRSSTTFQGFVKISTLTSHEGFGIAQSSGLEVGGVQFTLHMSTTAAEIFAKLSKADFIVHTATTISRTEWQTAKSTTVNISEWQTAKSTTVNVTDWTTAKSTTVNQVIWNVGKSTNDTDHEFFKTQNSTSDAQQTKFVNFRSTSDGLPRPSLQNPATGFFNMNQSAIGFSSGFYGGQAVLEGSVTVKGIVISSMGALLGGTTVQGIFVLEGGSITILSAGINKFTVVFASQPTVGQKLGVTQVSGERVVIGGVGDNTGLTSPITTGDWNVMNATHSSVNDTQNSTMTNIEKAIGVYNSTTPYGTISIPAAAWIGMMPSSASKVNGGYAMTSTGTSAFNIFGETFHLFDPPRSTATFAITSFRMPYEWDGSSIGFQVSWHASSGARTNVGWSLGGVSISSGDSVWQTFTTSVTVFSTFSSSWTEILSPMSAGYLILGTPNPGDRVKLRLSAGGANFEGFPRMTEVLIWYRKAVWDGRLR